jgi:hypothetical protein
MLLVKAPLAQSVWHDVFASVVVSWWRCGFRWALRSPTACKEGIR